jgi:hypothetical protein
MTASSRASTAGLRRAERFSCDLRCDDLSPGRRRIDMATKPRTNIRIKSQIRLGNTAQHNMSAAKPKSNIRIKSQIRLGNTVQHNMFAAKPKSNIRIKSLIRLGNTTIQHNVRMIRTR